MANGNGNGNANPASTEQIRLGAGFQSDERSDIVNRMRKLDRRLQRFDAEATDIEVSVKGRDSQEQQVVLEAWLPGHDRFVAVSREAKLKDALNHVRDEMWRQIDDAMSRKVSARRR
jgi:hypothetical protein